MNVVEQGDNLITSVGRTTQTTQTQAGNDDKMNATQIYKVTGKDAFGCRAQLKADGFVFDGDLKSWLGSQESIDRFLSRGFRVKVYFAKISLDPRLESKLFGDCKAAR